MSELDELFGIDLNDPEQQLARELTRGDFAWIDQLVGLRRRLGLSQAQVAERMGRSQSVVSDIETMSTDPRLSTLRRYAMALGAVVKHRVLPHTAVRVVSSTAGIQASSPVDTGSAIGSGSTQESRRTGLLASTR
ncbi:helix-turn-helix transcriptional regulator [Amycolatopsis sp. NPDC051372]|uniref:helix-turn-helix domain-containing protein n=1 Tax=Amycolatopsis sp. NPDC051372 TaxID=3155669 RepID=UPI003431B3DD